VGDIVGEGVVEERTSAVIVIEKLPALSSIAASMSQKLWLVEAISSLPSASAAHHSSGSG